MSQETIEPKISSQNTEYFTRASGHHADEIFAKAKRVSEISIVIAVAPPILLSIAVIALAILWTMGRPVLVKEERVGRDGRLVERLKFRTRVVDSTSGYKQMTLIGRFLEDSYLSDLPQLWNVIVGDMSIADCQP